MNLNFSSLFLGHLSLFLSLGHLFCRNANRQDQRAGIHREQEEGMKNRDTDCFKNISRAWRNISTVRRTCYSYWGPKFGSLRPHGGSFPFISDFLPILASKGPGHILHTHDIYIKYLRKYFWMVFQFLAEMEKCYFSIVLIISGKRT